jgi:hypothetical protein
VNRGDLEAALDELRHRRIDLGLEQHEVAHHIAMFPIDENAIQPPSASAGRMVTPSRVSQATPGERVFPGINVVWRPERPGAASDSSTREGSELAWPTHHRPPDEVVHEVPSDPTARHSRAPSVKAAPQQGPFGAAEFCCVPAG